MQGARLVGRVCGCVHVRVRVSDVMELRKEAGGRQEEFLA